MKLKDVLLEMGAAAPAAGPAAPASTGTTSADVAQIYEPLKYGAAPEEKVKHALDYTKSGNCKMCDIITRFGWTTGKKLIGEMHCPSCGKIHKKDKK